MDNAGVVQQFHDRLRRRWAIETGIVESVYSLDRGTTELLVAHGINSTLIPDASMGKDPETIARIVQDHLDVLEGLFAFINSERRLSTSYIRELHAAFFRHLLRRPPGTSGSLVEINTTPGEYKKCPNKPVRWDGVGHEYCPPEQFDSEMDRLIEFHLEQERRGVPTEVEAAWLHHRFTQIHPFADGNGRVARTLASLLFLRKKWFPLLIARKDKPAYIDALELADHGHLDALINLFIRSERSSYLEILTPIRDSVAVPLPRSTRLYQVHGTHLFRSRLFQVTAWTA